LRSRGYCSDFVLRRSLCQWCLVQRYQGLAAIRRSQLYGYDDAYARGTRRGRVRGRVFIARVLFTGFRRTPLG
jgi:hypothetical protein